MFKDIVKKQGISLYRLAKLSGVSYTAVNELYRGERSIEQCSSNTLFLLAKSLNLTMDELYKESLKRNKIPPSFKPYFWDVQEEKLDLLKNKNYIIPRLLTYGGYEGYNFVFSSYSYEDIKNVAMSSRTLNKKVATFLMNMFSIKKEDMRFFNKSSNWR